MKICLFSGTSDGREMSKRLAGIGIDVSVYVATEYGGEEQGEAEGIEVSVGRKTEEEMRELMLKHDLCIDATHPYAVIATENIRSACEAAGIPYYRLKRRETGMDESSYIISVKTTEEAIDWLREKEGRIMLTTGSKDLHKYMVLGPERLYPRVLPTGDSIRLCEEAEIPHRNIIAVQGPFVESLNIALIEQFDIDYMVTKNSGRAGGFDEKLTAAEKCKVPILVIERPKEEGLSADELFELCRRMK